MTKRDFELIAATLAAYNSRPGQSITGCIRAQARDEIAERLADSLASTNPRFDRTRFLRACGVEV